jgi:outer membrane protein assembly factor BamA
LRSARKVGAAIAFAALLLSSAAVTRAQVPPLVGETVVSLAYASDGPVDETELARLVTIRVGAPLTGDATASTIRNLFATGLLEDVVIEAEPSPGGVAVVLRLARSFRVFPLTFSGVPLTEEELRRIIGFSEGATFSK